MRSIHLVWLYRLSRFVLLAGLSVLLMDALGTVAIRLTGIAYVITVIGIAMAVVVELLFSFVARNAVFPTSPEGFPVAPSNVWVNDEAKVEIGTRVLAFWQNRWWRAVVIGFDDKDKVLIHFLGWHSIWNDYHKRHLLQFDTQEWVHEWPDNASSTSLISETAIKSREQSSTDIAPN